MGKEADLWDRILLALQVEPRSQRSILGVSGIEHELHGIGVDERAGRIIIVSAEHDARTTALMQADVQATMPDAKVLVIRPVTIDLNAVSRSLLAVLGETQFSVKIFHDQERSVEFFNETLKPILDPFVISLRDAPVKRLPQVLNVVQQLVHFDMSKLFTEGGVFSFKNFLSIDFTEMDRRLGVCHMPLYEFTPGDWELLTSGKTMDRVEERLVHLGIRQYFFPPIDHAALGIVDRGVTTPRDVTCALPLAPRMGHPFEQAEIVHKTAGILDVVDALQERGLLVEGELGLELSDEASTVRSNVKFRPREGAISRLVNRMRLEVNLNTKNWFGVTKE